MNREELIAAVSKETGLTKAQASGAVHAVVNNIMVELRGGESVVIFGFGSFKSVEKEARAGRNPSTGAAIQIQAKKVVKFTPAAALKDFIN